MKDVVEYDSTKHEAMDENDARIIWISYGVRIDC